MSQQVRTAANQSALDTHTATLVDVGEVTAASEAEQPDPPTRKLTVPSSPAALWTSVSDCCYGVEACDHTPDELRGWVAPDVVVSAN